MSSNTIQRTKLFVSYSHEDVRWFDGLRRQLAVLENEGILEVFEDTKLQVGDLWLDRLNLEMSHAQLSILLISASFLSSSFVLNHEVPKLYERHRTDGMLLYPLLVRACPWRRVPWLAKLQLRPQNSKRQAKPVAAFTGAAREQVLSNVATEIAELIEKNRKVPLGENASLRVRMPISEVRVAIVDDHPLLRRGMRDTLADAIEAEFIIVTEGESWTDALRIAGEMDLDAMVLDLNMPGKDWRTSLEEIRKLKPMLPLVICSMYPEDEYALRVLKAGAVAYVNKGGDPMRLPRAVKAAISGESLLTNDQVRMLQELGQQDDEFSLSDREMQVMLAIASGRRLHEVAELLSLSPKTVSVYRARVLERLGLSSNADIKNFAITKNLIR